MRSEGASARARGGDSGFTLVEMLVGLSLLALIMSFLAPALFEARRALRIVERPNPQAPIAAAQAYLRNGLTQIFPAIPGVTGDQSRLGVYGNATAFSYATSSAPQAGYQGLYVVVLQFAPRPGGGVDLVADEQLYRAPTNVPSTAPARRLVLVENVASGRFAFYGTGTNDDGAWRAEWPRARSIPQLISIEVSFHPGDERVWPTLWVRPAAAGASRISCPHRVSCD